MNSIRRYFCFFILFLLGHFYFSVAILAVRYSSNQVIVSSDDAYLGQSVSSLRSRLAQIAGVDVDSLRPIYGQVLLPHTAMSVGDSPSYFLLTLKNVSNIRHVLDTLWKKGINAQLNYYYTLQVSEPVPAVNDPYFNQDQPYLSATNIPLAWEMSKGSSDIIVAVLDTGVNYRHEDLLGKIWVNPRYKSTNEMYRYADALHGWNFALNHSDPMDHTGHGTSVAGLIAANTDNGVGIASAGYNAVIMPLRVTDISIVAETANLVSAIEFAVDHKAHIINISLGGELSDLDEDKLFKKAVKDAQEKGVLVVAPAGNVDNQPFNINEKHFVPAIYPGVLTVSGADMAGNFYSGSLYGESVDISAPSVSILSTSWSGISSSNNALYARKTGTSFAAPLVSGVAALLMAYNPKVTREDVIYALTQSSTDKGDQGKDIYTGYGFLNAAKAFKYVDPTPPIIEHQPIQESSQGVHIDIQATIYDEEFEKGVYRTAISAEIIYRWTKLNGVLTVWSSSKLTPLSEDGDNSRLYTGILPVEDSDIRQIEYYIKATNDARKVVFLPKSSQGASNVVPFKITLIDTSGPVIIIPTSYDYRHSIEDCAVEIRDLNEVNEESIKVVLYSSTIRKSGRVDGFITYKNNILLIPHSFFDEFKYSDDNVVLSVEASDNFNYTTSISKVLRGGSNDVGLPILFGPSGLDSSVINVPNPFNPSKEDTYISFELGMPAELTITIYSLMGELVYTYKSLGKMQTGYYEHAWKGKDSQGLPLPNGVYLCILQVKSEISSDEKVIKIAVLR